MFEIPASIPAQEFSRSMNTLGVKFTYRGGRKVRAVTHRMVSAANIDEVLSHVEDVVTQSRIGKID
jgi:hypothetical protein